ncbi:MAG: DUF5053 domain-containing protein [Tannerellaceae bacterium]|nr:DUF5053 domain-containing protein [Tannerellaceae bacterium]
MKDYSELRQDFLMLRTSFYQANPKEKELFEIRVKEYLKDKTPEEALIIADIMMECMDEDIEELDTINQEIKLRKTLERVYDAISWSYIAEHYFGKSRSWLNQRLNNFLVNGKEAHFTADELKTLQQALLALSKDIEATALGLSIA